MKEAIIVALVCLNAALLVALVFGAATPAADAQVIRGGTNYLVMTGDIGDEYDAVYVLDLSSRRIAAYRFNMTTKRLVPVARRDLPRDFGKPSRR